MVTTTTLAPHRQAFRRFQECGPSGRLLWNLDARLDWIAGLPACIRSLDELRLELGCTWGLRQAGWVETADGTMEVATASTDGSEQRIITTPVGTLRSRMRLGHPEEHPVKGPGDLPALLHYYSHLRVSAPEPKDIDFASLGPSPVQQLLEYDMGLETCYGLLADRPAVMTDLLAVMDERHLERTRAACALPGGGLLLGENTSTAMISPAKYRALSLPGLRRQAELVHGHGKRLRLHMCGHLRNLLAELGRWAWTASTPSPRRPSATCPSTSASARSAASRSRAG